MPDKRPARILVVAGPTAEDIDPVRFITNRSSGRTGLELVRAAKRAGADVRLILGPTHLEPEAGTEVARVRSAEDMCRAVVANLAWADGLVMAAAVADYTPAEPLSEKIRKKDGDLLLRLRRTPDILATIRDLPERQGKFVVGFSLDVAMNLDEGRRKLRDKGLDLIVVNTTAAFGTADTRAWLVSAEGETECGSLRKEALADRLISAILNGLSSRSAG